MTVQAKTFAPSPYQTAVFDAVANPDAGNLMVEAVAGSGKTTTIVKALEATEGRVMLLAFNKSIAQELARKIPAHCEARTFHSLGMRALGLRGAKVDGRKNWQLMDELGYTRQTVRVYGSFVNKLVGLAKQAGIGALVDDVDRTEWLNLVDHHNMVLRDKSASVDEAITMARRVLAKAGETLHTIDFDDMLWLPVKMNRHFTPADWVFGDEAQDTNRLQAEIVWRIIANGGRVCFVGDSRQAIYGFRGADSTAMDRLAQRFDCTRLPLSVSYRCARAVVDAAKAYCPQIEAFEGAADGSVETLANWSLDDISVDDAVVCRNVAPLLSLAYQFIGARRPVQVLGRDIGKGLVTLMEKIAGTRAKTVDQFMSKLAAWEARELAKAEADNRPDLAARITDQAECLHVVANAMPLEDATISAMKRSLESLFDNRTGPTPTLCTVHKSKGLEWDRVFILDPHRMPSPWAKHRAWMMEQENNLHYVAITRAKRDVRYITLEE